MKDAKDLVRATLALEGPATVPYWLRFSPTVTARLLKHYQSDDIDEAVDNSIVMVWAGPARFFRPPPLPPPQELDEFGTLWHRLPDNPGYLLRAPLADDPDLDRYSFPDPRAPGRYDHLPAYMKRHRGRFVLGLMRYCLFEQAHFLRGFEDLLMDFVRRPSYVEELLDRIVEYNLALAEGLLGHPIDAYFISDDWGDQRGVTLGPERWRRFIKPRLDRLLARPRELGIPLFIHSDGNISDILPDLMELGVTAVHPAQPEVMDLAGLRRRLGPHLTFVGGISTQHTLPFGTAQQVRQEVMDRRGELWRGGGFIIGPGIIVQEDVPWPNVLALVEMCREGVLGGI